MLCYLRIIDNFFWSYIGWSSVIFMGIYFTIYSKAFQFRQILLLPKNLKYIFNNVKDVSPGVNPIKIFFASAGGMIGLGNLTGVTVAIMLGGPGSIFWTFTASLLGSLLKYSEIFLGIKYRVLDKYTNSYNGGPMYFIQAAFKSKIWSYLFCIFLILYAVEIYQFKVLSDMLCNVINIKDWIVIASFLILTLFVAHGGVARIGTVATLLMPVFFLAYVISSVYIILQNKHLLWNFICLVFGSAFSDSAPIGGFVGSSLILSVYLGISKAVYSGDICIGYDSIMQSESKLLNPQKQGVLAIYAIIMDGLICVCTNLVIGITGSWFVLNGLEPAQIIPHIFSQYFSDYSKIFIYMLFFIAGFTTILAYFNAGVKAAMFLFPKYGKFSFYIYACFAFWTFSYLNLNQSTALLFMSIISGILMLINSAAIFKLRNEIKFDE